MKILVVILDLLTPSVRTAGVVEDAAIGITDNVVMPTVERPDNKIVRRLSLWRSLRLFVYNII